jgi:hypothetical protein
MVVVYFLWFYFHRKGIVIAMHKHNHDLPYQPRYSVWLTTLEVSGHILGPILRPPKV